MSSYINKFYTIIILGLVSISLAIYVVFNTLVFSLNKSPNTYESFDTQIESLSKTLLSLEGKGKVLELEGIRMERMNLISSDLKRSETYLIKKYNATSSMYSSIFADYLLAVAESDTVSDLLKNHKPSISSSTDIRTIGDSFSVELYFTSLTGANAVITHNIYGSTYEGEMFAYHVDISTSSILVTKFAIVDFDEHQKPIFRGNDGFSEVQYSTTTDTFSEPEGVYKWHPCNTIKIYVPYNKDRLILTEKYIPTACVGKDIFGGQDFYDAFPRSSPGTILYEVTTTFRATPKMIQAAKALPIK